MKPRIEYEVRSNEGLEAVYLDHAAAQRYADTIRKELGVVAKVIMVGIKNESESDL